MPDGTFCGTDSEIDKWLESLDVKTRLEVFKVLSGYLSTKEIKNVIGAAEKGEGLLSIHKRMGLLKKYYVDLLRIRRLMEKRW